MGYLDRDQMHSTKGFPYQEALVFDERFEAYRPTICPRCGSLLSTNYRSVMSEITERGVISGDLEIKSLTISRCLNCGNEHPIIFDQRREV